MADGSTQSNAISNDKLMALARHALSIMEKIARGADQALRNRDEPNSAALVNRNTLTGDKAFSNLRIIAGSERQSLLQLTKEPVLARLVIRDDNDHEKILYISRTTPAGVTVDKDTIFASYRAPMGRLASIQVGRDEDIKTPRGTHNYEVAERATLSPVQVRSEWDSKDTIYQVVNFRPITLKSLLVLLETQKEPEDVLAELERILKKDAEQANIVAGIKRSVIEKMELRDRPLLDQFQDEIFRLPLDSRLVLLGPPGTGKTTTMIKRLGLKIDKEFLDEHEQSLVEGSQASLAGHSASWLVFTPTELLKQYVKEAFARENVPAPDERIQTWEDYRRGIARQKLGILRTSTKRGFILKDNAPTLMSRSLETQDEWFDDFFAAQSTYFWDELDAQAKILSQSSDQDAARIGRRINDLLPTQNVGIGTAILVSLDNLSREHTELAGKIRTDIDTRLRIAFALELRRDERLLEDLLEFLSKVGGGLDSSDEDEIEADEEDDESAVQKGDREEAFDAYLRAMRARARSLLSRRSISRESLNGQILQWLGTRVVPDAELLAIGQQLQVQSALRRFTNPIRHYVARMPARYRRFRRERQGTSKWYADSGFEANDLNPLEVDAIILGMMRSTRALVGDPSISRKLDDGRYAILKGIKECFRTQILVDEATDFSPIQLACMAGLGDPGIGSFIACGDFNQRITEWGSRARDELAWAVPGIETRNIQISYRHSEQLVELARKIAEMSGSEAINVVLPTDIDSSGFKPALAHGVDGEDAMGWIASRIEEIERHSNKLPSIAVLVNSEAEVQSVAQMLGQKLSSNNIHVSACPEGKVVGQDNDVRVFNIQHIKGLEFEAVFFVAVDELARLQPKLFDKYLYVGATRAATYLGVTCIAPQLPKEMAPLEALFTRSWQD